MLDTYAPARRIRPPAPPRPDSRGGTVVGRIQMRAFVDRDPRWALYFDDGRRSNTFAVDLDRDGVAALLADAGLTLQADNTVVRRAAASAQARIVGHAERGVFIAEPDHLEAEAWLIHTAGSRHLVLLPGDRAEIAVQLAQHGLALQDDNSISGAARPCDLVWPERMVRVAELAA